MRAIVIRTAVAMFALCASTAALAHPHHEKHPHDFSDGLLHPLTSWEHLVTVVLVALLARRVAGWRAWLVPAAFIGACLAGAVLGPLSTTSVAIAAVIAAVGGLAIRLSWLEAVALGVLSAIGFVFGAQHAPASSSANLGFAVGMIVLQALALAGITLVFRTAIRSSVSVRETVRKVV